MRSFFWGINMDPARTKDGAVWYQTALPGQLVLSTACLLDDLGSDAPTQVWLRLCEDARTTTDHLVALLTPGRTESVRLELYFTPRQNVSFLCVGAARVSLGGVIHRAEVHEEDPMEEFEHNLMAMMNGFGAPVELDASKLGPEQQRVAGLLQNVFEERAKRQRARAQSSLDEEQEEEQEEENGAAESAATPVAAPAPAPKAKKLKAAAPADRAVDWEVGQRVCAAAAALHHGRKVKLIPLRSVDEEFRIWQSELGSGVLPIPGVLLQLNWCAYVEDSKRRLRCIGSKDGVEVRTNLGNLPDVVEATLKTMLHGGTRILAAGPSRNRTTIKALARVSGIDLSAVHEAPWLFLVLHLQ